MVSLQQCWTQPGRAALSKYGLGLRRFLGYGDAQTLLCMTIVDCEVRAIWADRVGRVGRGRSIRARTHVHAHTCVRVCMSGVPLK